MIIGVGTDIVKIDRIRKILRKYGTFFKARILTSLEMQNLEKIPLDKHANFIAKRFAGKEAISKALGTGIGENIQFKDISILNDDKGRPYAEIISKKLDQFKQFKISLSLSDDYPIAIAFAVVSV